MPTTPLLFDKTTLEAQLARAIQDRTSLENFGNHKQKELAEITAKINTELDKIRGALEYNTMVIDHLKKDLVALTATTDSSSG